MIEFSVLHTPPPESKRQAESGAITISTPLELAGFDAGSSIKPSEAGTVRDSLDTHVIVSIDSTEGIKQTQSKEIRV
jgi:hypothetical protein